MPLFTGSRLGFGKAVVAVAEAAAAEEAYQVEKSLRFNSGDSAYLNKTPSSAGDQTTWTWSGWIKRPKLSVLLQTFFGSQNGSNREVLLSFWNDDTLRWLATGTGSNSYILNLKTTPVFRDPSAWYHIVATWDGNNGTQADKARLYVNGVRVTSFSTNTNTISSSSYLNGANQHFIGKYVNYSNSATYSDGLIAEVHFVDGLALDASSFGETATTGQWVPIEYTHVASPNDGITWSGQVTGTEDSGWEKIQMFDSSLSNATRASAGNSLTFTPSPTFSSISSLRIKGRKTGSGSLTVNGTSYDSLFGSSTGWATIPESSLSNVVWNNVSGSNGTQFDITAIEVNGHILLDGAVDNSFHFKFDNTSDLGEDSSGNGNDWTANNLSTTAGAGNDQLADSPTTYDDEGNGVGNYATLNPLFESASTYSNGNLDVVTPSGTGHVRSTLGMSSGKWYFEGEWTSGSSGALIGLVNDPQSSGHNLGQGSNGWGYYSAGTIQHAGSDVSSAPDTFANGDIIGIAFDADAGNLYFYKNGTLQGGTQSGLTSGPYYFALCDGGSSGTGNFSVNFGQRDFEETVPTGYKALNTFNLPDPTIADPSVHFDTKLWTGTDTDNTDIGGFNFQPDMVWLKRRDSTGVHGLWDELRGTNILDSSSTSSDTAYGTPPIGGYVSQFNSDGFRLRNGSTNNSYTHLNLATYVGWAWDAGSSTVSNTDGSITSSVRANPTAGFSIVSFTPSTDSSVGHGLNATPGVVIYKNREASGKWRFHHKDVGVSKTLYLNTNEAEDANTDRVTAVTSTTFTVGAITAGDDHIAYCWSEVEGFSKFGSFEGNSDPDGPFIWCGFKPRWVMVKVTSTTNNWVIVDSKRDTYNIVGQRLRADLSNAEDTQDAVDFVSNGFKIRTGSASTWNDSETYIYCAWAESPFKYSNAR